MPASRDSLLRLGAGVKLNRHFEPAQKLI